MTSTTWTGTGVKEREKERERKEKEEACYTRSTPLDYRQYIHTYIL